MKLKQTLCLNWGTGICWNPLWRVDRNRKPQNQFEQQKKMCWCGKSGNKIQQILYHEPALCSGHAAHMHRFVPRWIRVGFRFLRVFCDSLLRPSAFKARPSDWEDNLLCRWIPCLLSSIWAGDTLNKQPFLPSLQFSCVSADRRAPREPERDWHWSVRGDISIICISSDYRL